MKVLLVTLYFPPAGGGGVQRPLKFATHLPALGLETHVLAPDRHEWIHQDPDLPPPSRAWVHRARYVGPKARRPAEELHGLEGLDRLARRASLFGRRLLVPDEGIGWNVTAIPAAVRIVRDEGIDVVVTTSPPPSVHLVGAATKRATGVRWIADFRDSPGSHPHRRGEEHLGARLKEEAQRAVARLVAAYADAIVAAAPAIADEARSLAPSGRVVTIENGCDFEDFSGLEYRRSDRFRITHTGSFFGKRTPRPFVTALAESGDDVIARFVGDFRKADEEWAEGLGLGDRLELIPYVSRRRALELQRDSEALLLLVPEAAGRGRGVLTAKIFEYLAAERPILAAVPPQGAAASLLRQTGAGIVVAPDDVRGMREALGGLVARWRAGRLDGSALTAAYRDRLSRRARAEELAELVRSVA
jgi:glycosyltransferase involved in cell wall biosynthesis